MGRKALARGSLAGMRHTTVCTWNIHACIGSDGEFRPRRVAKVLEEIDADVVALQEVEHRAVDGLDILDFLSACTEMEAIPGPTLERGGHAYGNALLSRLPLTDCQRHDLSWPGREPRGAIDAFFSRGGRSLRVLSTHLGLRPVERRAQVRTLLRRLESRKSDCAVLMGDLNEWLLWGRPLRWLRRHFSPTPDIGTFPSRWPLFALDQLWVEPVHILQRLRAHRSPLARIASDHLPLVGELRFDSADSGLSSAN